MHRITSSNNRYVTVADTHTVSRVTAFLDHFVYCILFLFAFAFVIVYFLYLRISFSAMLPLFGE